MNQDIRLNLLPWRQARRHRLKLEFFWVLAAAAALAGLAVAGLDRHYASLLERQSARNAFLERQLASLDGRIKETETRRQTRQALLDKLAAIRALEARRQTAARILDELALLLAPGIHFTHLALRGDTLELQGHAETGRQVSSQLRRFQAAAWLAEPQVKGLAAQPQRGRQATRFDLILRRRQPAPEGGQ